MASDSLDFGFDYHVIFDDFFHSDVGFVVSVVDGAYNPHVCFVLLTWSITILVLPVIMSARAHREKWVRLIIQFFTCSHRLRMLLPRGKLGWFLSQPFVRMWLNMRWLFDFAAIYCHLSFFNLRFGLYAGRLSFCWGIHFFWFLFI